MTSLSHQKRRVGIIGAGLGGLSAAVALANAGFQVTVYEKNEGPGGKLGQFEKDGYQWDTGPSTLLMPDILASLFTQAGQKLEDYLTLVRLPNLCRYRWQDGTVIDMDERFLERPDVARFLAHCRGIFEISKENVFSPELREWWDPLRPANLRKLRHLPAVLNPQSMAGSLKRFFSDERLRQVFGHAALYFGSSPYKAPAACNVVSYLQAHYGGWYVKGGMSKIAAALYKLARRFSVDFRFNAAITGARRIPKGHALAVDAQWEHFDYVVCNKDALSAYQTLVSRELSAWFKREYLKRRPSSLSAFILFLGVNKKYDDLAHHNVFFSRDIPQEHTELFEQRTPAEEPTLQLSVSSRTDPSRAPEGCDNWFVAAPAPPLGRKTRWSEIGPGYCERILDRLEEFGFKDLRQHLAVKEWLGPSHFRSRFSSYAGAIHGFAAHGLSAGLTRPAIETSALPGFYFVGGSTQPGAGIPMVLLSGQKAAQKIIAAADEV